MSVILQIKLNGGAPQTGGVDAVDGDLVQLTAASKATWGSPAAEWRIHSFREEFPQPAGWSSDANGYYYLGNDDPPSFTVDLATWWGKLGMTLTAMDGGAQVVDTATALRVFSPSGLGGIFKSEGSQFGGNREQWVQEINRDLGVIDGTIGVVNDLAAPTRETVPNNDAVLTTDADARWITREAKTQSGAGTPKAITVAASSDPTVSGEERIARTVPGRVREYLINPDGSFISWLTNEGAVRMRWRADLGAGGRWVADRVYASKLVYRIEDYAVAGPVGIGNATYDDAAWAALRADLETLDLTQRQLIDSQAVVELFGRYKTTTGWVLRSHWGYTDYLVKGASAGLAPASLMTSQLEYTGPTALYDFNVSLVFNRAARSIRRTTGSWVTAGVTVGMRLKIPRGSVSNNRIHQAVTSITTTTNPNDTLILAAPEENPVGAWDTSAILPADEGPVSCDWIQWIAGFEFRGSHNSRIEDFGVWSRDGATGRGKFTCGVWMSIKQDNNSNESSSNNLVQRVSVSGVLGVHGARGIAIGMSGGSPAIGSQCDSLRIRDCHVQNVIDYGVVGTFTVAGNVLTFGAVHGLKQDEPVKVSVDITGLFPAALNWWTTYYVRVVTTTTIELSLTRGGAALALVSTGSGTRRLKRPLLSTCIGSEDGNNTKVFYVRDCLLTTAARAIDYELASDGSSIESCQFDTIGEVAVVAYAAGAQVIGCQGERLAGWVWGPPNGSPVSVRSCSFHGETADNDWQLFKGNLNLDRVFGNNTRSEYQITSVDTAANTVSFVASSASEAPCENQRVVVRNSTSPNRTPGGVAETEDYWLGSITVAGSTYTAQLCRADGPLYALDLTSAGTGTSYLMSEVGWTSGDSSAFSPRMNGCTLWGSGRVPRITGTNRLPLWMTGNSLTPAGTAAIPRIRATGNTAIIGNIAFAMADIEPDDAACYPIFSVDLSDMRLHKPGKLTIIEMDWRKLATGSGAASRGAFYPRRAGIRHCFVEVVPDDASAVGLGGGTISAATISVGYNGAGNLLAAFDVFAGSFGDIVERRGGFQASEVGTLLKGADGESKTFWPRDVATTDTGWITLSNGQLTVDITLTGGAFSALTQGRIRLYILWEMIPQLEAT